MEEKNIKIPQPHSLADVVNSIRKGEWKIPRFQRGFVWEKSKVIELLDSMYKEFPIGSFFLWIPPDEYTQYYKDIPELRITPDGKKHYTHFILDGQQRLTSLYVTAQGLEVDGFNYRNICFDLDTEKFNAGPPDLERTISVHQIVNPNLYLDLYDKLSRDRKPLYMKAKDRLNNYPFPIVIIENKNIEEACKIFERINQGGKRLNIFDLVVAITWDKDFELKTEIKQFNKKIEHNFGWIDEEVFTETISLVVNKQCTKAFQLKLTPAKVKDAWDGVKEAIGLSAQFLRSVIGVPKYSYLPYRDIIALIAYYYFECRAKSIEPDKKFLEEWFWKLSFSNRYSTATFTKMGEDRAEIFDKKLLGEEVEIRYDININEDKITGATMGRSTAFRNALLLIMIQNKPLSFNDCTPVDVNNDAVSLFNKSERHHIFPKAYLKSIGIKEKKETDLVMNFCWIDSMLNKDISYKAPASYFEEFKTKNQNLQNALDSHLIPGKPDSAIWNNNYSEFISERSKLFDQEIRKRVGEVLTVKEEMARTPEKLIQRTEIAVRETIADVLYEAYGEDWWHEENVIPQDLIQPVEDKIRKEKSNKPYVSDEEWNTGSRKLQQLNIPDYQKIILKNWNCFEDIFGSKANVTNHFLAFSNIRNQINHVKTMDEIEREFGETSIKWIQKCLREEDESKPEKPPIVRPILNELYEELRKRIIGLDPEIVELNKEYISAFNKENSVFNFAKIRLCKANIRVRAYVGSQEFQKVSEIGEDKTDSDAKELRKIIFKVLAQSDLETAIRLLTEAYNTNEKYIQKQQAKIKPIHRTRIEFWKGLIGKAKELNSDFQNVVPHKHNWLWKSSGESGISYYLSIYDSTAYATISLDLREKHRNKERFAYLEKSKHVIEENVGESLWWEPYLNHRDSEISLEISGGLGNRDKWPTIQEQLLTSMKRLESAVQPYLSTLP